MRINDTRTHYEFIANLAKVLGEPVELRWRKFVEAYRRYNGVEPDPAGTHGHGVGCGRHSKDTQTRSER